MMPAQTGLPEQGEIAAFLLPRLILEAWRARFSGQLLLEQENQRKQVLFHAGAPVQVLSNRPSDSLALFLQQSGQLSHEEARLTRHHARKHGGHEGVAVMKLGLMDPSSLFPAIRAQLERSLCECFCWRGGRYRLDPENPPSMELAPFRLDPIAIVQRGIQEAYGNEVLLTELKRHLDRYAVRQIHTKAIWERLHHSLPLDPMRWDPEQDLKNNLAGIELSLGNASALWVLVASGGLTFTDSDGEEDPSPRPTPAPARDPGPRPRTETQTCHFEKDLDEQLEGIQTTDHYRLLGVLPGCPTKDLRKAYLRAAKQYHPDTTLKYGRDDLKEKSAVLFSRITEAFEVLSDPQQRQRYDACLRGDAPEASADQIAQAEMGYQKANVLLRMGQFHEAIAYLQQAVDLVPEEEDFHAALGWALFKTAPSEPRRAREALEEAVRLKPDHALAHFRLGIVCRGLGDTDAADTALAKAKELENAQAHAS